MEKKREYTHEDMEALGKEIEVLRIRARQVDQDIRNGAISHEQWVSAAYELMERKKGGETVTSGVNPQRLPWKIGVTKPTDDSLSISGEMQSVLNVTDLAMATSGNYRNF